MSTQCTNCEYVLQSNACRNSRFLFECSSCADSSFQVRKSGLQDVHGTPRTFLTDVIMAGGLGMFGDYLQEEAYQLALREFPWEPWSVKGAAVAAAKAAPPAGGAVRIGIIAMGSRGDVQPAAGLALALQRVDVRVRMFVTEKTEHLTQALSLDAVGCPNWVVDPVQCFQSDGGAQRALYEGVRAFMPDLLLYSKTACVEAWVIEEQLGIPTIEYSFQPQTTADNPPLWKSQLIATRIHFDLGLGLRTLRGWNEDSVRDRSGRSRPVLLAVSQKLRNPDKPSAAAAFTATATTGIHVTGFWAIEGAEQEELMQKGNSFFSGSQHDKLAEFLAKGPPPVCIGWGSMVMDRGTMEKLAVRALKEVGRRGIIVGGWAGLDGSALGMEVDLTAYAATNVLWLESAPHEWLLPRCSMAVHHGGAGTTAAALRAGVPSVITPVAFDQDMWGRAVATRGVGEITSPFSVLSASELAEAMRRCEGEEVVQDAAVLGQRVRAEGGVARAVQVIAGYLEATAVRRRRKDWAGRRCNAM